MSERPVRVWPARLAAWLVAVWAGCLLALSLGVAPIAFQTFPRELAGAFMGKLFAVEAPLSCLVAMVALVLHRQSRARTDAEGSAGGLDGPVLMMAGVIFCTVVGYYGLQPVMAQARSGGGALSFSAAHGLSMAFFGIRLVLLAVAAWWMGR